MPAFAPNDLVMIEGTFPAARYFAYQTFDGNFSPVGFLRDAQIQPVTGERNPFAKGPKDDMKDAHSKNDVKYRIYLTKDGKRGFPNELAMAKSNFALGSLVIVVLRLYGVDSQAKFTHPELAPWGYVPPVQVSTKIMGYVIGVWLRGIGSQKTNRKVSYLYPPTVLCYHLIEPLCRRPPTLFGKHTHSVQSTTPWSCATH